MYLPSNGAFPGCQVLRKRDGSYWVNRSPLWAPVHSENHKSKPSCFVKQLPDRLKFWHKELYPGDDQALGCLQPFCDDESGTMEEVAIGEGMHVHLLMAYFWWSFSGDRTHRERSRNWENRLAAASCFRDFLQSVLRRLPNEVTFHILWGGKDRRPCKLRDGILDMQPLGRWRELPALSLLGFRWAQQAAHTSGNGMHWVRGSPYFAPLGDLLVGGAMLSNPTSHSDLLTLLRDVMAQLGNLILALMPRLVTTDARVMQAKARHHHDKGLLCSWVNEVLHKGRFASLPALLRSLQIAGIGQLCTRIYKDWHQHKLSHMHSPSPQSMFTWELLADLVSPPIGVIDSPLTYPDSVKQGILLL